MDMTADEMFDAYGPDGPSPEDVRTWHEAVERTCEHDDALAAMDALNRDGLCCPTCGKHVSRAAVEYRDAETAAEDRYWRQVYA